MKGAMDRIKIRDSVQNLKCVKCEKDIPNIPGPGGGGDCIIHNSRSGIGIDPYKWANNMRYDVTKTFRYSLKFGPKQELSNWNFCLLYFSFYSLSLEEISAFIRITPSPWYVYENYYYYCRACEKYRCYRSRVLECKIVYSCSAEFEVRVWKLSILLFECSQLKNCLCAVSATQRRETAIIIIIVACVKISIVIVRRCFE